MWKKMAIFWAKFPNEEDQATQEICDLSSKAQDDVGEWLINPPPPLPKQLRDRKCSFSIDYEENLYV